MSTNFEYRTRERQKKRESLRQASETHREKGDRGLGREIKTKKEVFFWWKNNKKICSGGDKMRNASGHQCKVKMSCSEKKMNQNTYEISSKKRVTKKFLKVSRCNLAKQRQKNVQKSVLHVQSCFSANYTYCCFHRSPALPSPLNITRFYILFEQTLNIIESFAFSPG